MTGCLFCVVLPEESSRAPGYQREILQRTRAATGLT